MANDIQIQAVAEAANQILFADILTHGQTLVLPLGEDVNNWQIVTSLLDIGITHDSDYRDNFFSGATCSSTIVTSGSFANRAWTITAQAFFGWGGPGGAPAVRNIRCNVMVIKKN